MSNNDLNNGKTKLTEEHKQEKKHERKFAYIFGTVTVLLVLVLAFVFNNPTPFQYLVLRTILSLGAAGVGSRIPGFLNVTIEPKKKFAIQASGAIGLFLIVYFTNPAEIAIETEALKTA